MNIQSESVSADFIDNLIALIKKRLSKLSPKQKAVGEIILENPSFISFATIQELALEADVNVATVVRFCRSLGFAGYTDLRNAIRHYNINRSSSVNNKFISEINNYTDHRLIQNAIDKDLQNIKDLRLSVREQPFLEVCNALNNANNILCIGSGGSFGAKVFASLLNHIGINADYEVRGGTYLGRKLKKLKTNDLLICFGFYRCDQIVIKGAEWAKDQQIKTVAITDSMISPLTNYSDLILKVSTKGYSFFQSNAAVMTLINSLIVFLAESNQKQTLKAIKKGQEVFQALGLKQYAKRQFD